jgi:ketose-bisphosphate aldolase
MTLANFSQLLAHALRHGYAIGYFESWDMYSMEGALEAAEQARAPAIIGFGGAVTTPAWLDHNGVEIMSGLARRLAETARVPVAVLFNEAQTVEQVARGLAGGCNAVMLGTAHLPFDENVAVTQQVVSLAHRAGAAVEAELGHLPDAIDPDGHGVLTDPEEARRFVELTGVDALAVSVGNVHMAMGAESPVDMARLAAIHAAVPVPLVVHGGTGFPAAAVRRAIGQGVVKFNVGTRLKRLYLAGIRDACPEPMSVPDIHPYVGSHDALDVLAAGKERVKAAVLEYIDLYGSAGQAGAPPEAM